jgi:hypothetical protein
LPKIRFSDLPHGLWKHLLERVQEREITLADLGRLQEWVISEPFAHDGDWHKDFGTVQAVRHKRVSEDGTHEKHGGVRQTNRVEASDATRQAVPYRPSRSLSALRIAHISSPMMLQSKAKFADVAES